ncbi:sn-glycerol-3-phosphate ABC transporter ATP-binding protein UgpC [Frigidibacter sp. RF13]|uniref:ABC transporter ATP-binding protein n=1 Tax=Frigidibacter sp. RF13 TaxID=2997340 RepID=UPI00226EE2A6|nr:sn-glycerol-3-phosphate ABC transporter ATP-binding protein UgpC [Frigidibacter sp. RF13]MCY1126099.1 sn-glycerol-3-phosphate ABC transporter ATP-binding protein UgpC [Frigidibacter sp. RF13]
MSQLALSNLTKSFGAAEVIKGVTLDVEEGEFVVFVGPSGCGNSTLLRMIAGLEDVSTGEIVIGGRPVKDLPPVKRGIAMVFQSYALYPHMTVFENIAFPLRVEGLTEADIRRRVEEAASVLQLTQRLGQKPGTLSGGQRQRVAIGRAIVRQPKIFLFDEPLSNLDAALRSEMRIELMRLHKSLGTTMIYVTHDQVEAMTMADKIVVLNGGRVEQVGAPLELYERPRNQFVAGFIGSPKMNFLPGRCLSATEVDLGPLGRITIPARPSLAPGQEVTIGIRPEHLSLGPGAVSLTVRPTLIERLGIHTIAYSPLADGQNFIALFDGKPGIADGVEMQVSVPADQLYLFDTQGNSLPAV